MNVSITLQSWVTPWLVQSKFPPPLYKMDTRWLFIPFSSTFLRRKCTVRKSMSEFLIRSKFIILIQADVTKIFPVQFSPSLESPRGLLDLETQLHGSIEYLRLISISLLTCLLSIIRKYLISPTNWMLVSVPRRFNLTRVSYLEQTSLITFHCKQKWKPLSLHPLNGRHVIKPRQIWISLISIFHPRSVPSSRHAFL